MGPLHRAPSPRSAPASRPYSGPVPVTVACLVPAAPLLLPRLTGSRVPEAEAVRAAVTAVLGALTGLDRLLVVAPSVPGTLAGFGAPEVPGAPGAPRFPAPLGSWPHALAQALLDDVAGSPADRTWLTWDDVDQVSGSAGSVGSARSVASAGPAAGDRTGLLLLADGSRTRGPRAPGGDDPRGEGVDAELVAALRAGRPPVVPDADAVGATAGPAVRLLVELTAGRPGAVDVLHADAPLGVFYLVALARLAGT